MPNQNGVAGAFDSHHNATTTAYDENKSSSNSSGNVNDNTSSIKVKNNSNDMAALKLNVLNEGQDNLASDTMHNGTNKHTDSSLHYTINNGDLNSSCSSSSNDGVEELINRPLRIMIITESFHPYTSGIARRFKEILERLAKRGFLIHILTGCKGCETWTSDEELKDKVTFSQLIAIEFKDKIDCALPFLIPQYEMIRALITFKPDVVHCVEQTPASTFFATLAKTMNIPIVWSSHTNLDYYIPLYIHPTIAPISVRVNKLLRRTFLNAADYNLTVSSDFARWLNHEGGVRGRIHVWKTGVDSESFRPAARSYEMRVRMFNGHYAPDKILLVSVGRLSPEKNFEFLRNILQRFPKTFLCIVGGGPYKERLEPLFPPDQTHFIGFLQGEELAAAYASADYFVYASVSETFGQVYLEAMSSGIPVVAAEGKQMREFFVSGIHGYTWKPQDVESACHALNEAMRDRNMLAQNCRSNALQHSWTSAANQIADVYRHLAHVGERRRRNEHTRLVQYVRRCARAVYFLAIWLYLTFLVLTLVAPFMKVAKPASSSSSLNDSLSSSPVNNNNNNDVDEYCDECDNNKKRKRHRTAQKKSSSSSSESSRESSMKPKSRPNDTTAASNKNGGICFFGNEKQVTLVANNGADNPNSHPSKRHNHRRCAKTGRLQQQTSQSRHHDHHGEEREHNSEGFFHRFISQTTNFLSFSLGYHHKINSFVATLSALLISLLSITAIYAIFINFNSNLF